MNVSGPSTSKRDNRDPPASSPTIEAERALWGLGANGQYKVTIPKGPAEAMELEGETLKWKVKSSEALEVRVVDDD